MSLSMSSRTVATPFPHISFNTDSRHPEVVNKLPNLLLTSDLDRVEGGGNQRAKLLCLNSVWKSGEQGLEKTDCSVSTWSLLRLHSFWNRHHNAGYEFQ